MKPYLKYVYEVIAIVVGITLSFMVDEWREERQNWEKEKVILKEIYNERKADSLMLSYNLQIHKNGFASCINLIKNHNKFLPLHL